MDIEKAREIWSEKEQFLEMDMLEDLVAAQSEIIEDQQRQLDVEKRKRKLSEYNYRHEVKHKLQSNIERDEARDDAVKYARLTVDGFLVSDFHKNKVQAEATLKKYGADK